VEDTAGTGTLSGVTKISAGQGFACALLANTTAVCWGNSTFQSIARGPGANATRPSPLVVNGTSTPLSGITDISAGRDHSCALIVDGTARCWGHNFDGELGNNGSGDGYATVLNSAGSAPLGNITKIAAGYRQTCAVLGDQTARCWGYNYDGELGNGGSGNTDVRRRLPVTVISDTTNTALTGVDDIVTGSDHACALLSDNTARCWGSNGWLQLGNGDLLVPGNCTSTQAPCSTKATLVRDAAGTALNGISEVSAAMGYDTCARLTRSATAPPYIDAFRPRSVSRGRFRRRPARPRASRRPRESTRQSSIGPNSPATAERR
jgi:alpha-tubulin suppressor-like RCC1 family protein